MAVEEMISSYEHFFMGPIYSVSFSILVGLGVFDTILNSRAGSVIASVILVVFLLMMYTMLYVIASKSRGIL